MAPQPTHISYPKAMVFHLCSCSVITTTEAKSVMITSGCEMIFRRLSCICRPSRAFPEQRRGDIKPAVLHCCLDVKVSRWGEVAITQPPGDCRGVDTEQGRSGVGAAKGPNHVTRRAQGFATIPSHEDEDSSTELNASILTTPQWRDARKLNIYGGMARGLIPERNRLVAQRLLWTRTALQLKQNKFATDAGLSPTTYNQWETGVVHPPVDGAMKLCEAHELTLDWIYRGKMGSLPSTTADGIKALMAIDAARQPSMKVVQPKRRNRSAA